MRKNEVSLYGDSFFEDFLFGPISRQFTKDRMMRTDIKETDDSFEFDIELPGIKKDDINIELDEGKLTISYSENYQSEEKDEGKYIRRERYYGNNSRSFFVGEDVTQKDIKARFENGVLNIIVSKEKRKEKVTNRIKIS